MQLQQLMSNTLSPGASEKCNECTTELILIFNNIKSTVVRACNISIPSHEQGMSHDVSRLHDDSVDR